MSILTNGESGRATKRRKLRSSPADAELLQLAANDSRIEPDASDTSSLEDEKSVPATKWSGSHQRQPNGNNAAILSQAGLSRTSMLALQVNELLAGTRTNQEKLELLLAPTVQRLIELIQQIPARQPALLKDAERTLRVESGVRIPFTDSRPAKDSKYKFGYQAPESIDYLGSVVLTSGPKASMNVITLAVRMPESLFQEKDYLNHRAFYKRAFYLACIAADLKKGSHGDFELCFQSKDDLALIPLLVFRPSQTSPEDFEKPNSEIHITATFPTNSIPIEKTDPGKNCVREEGKTTATPIYNSCARVLASLSIRQRMIHDSKKTCESLSDTSRLASIWLQQRGMGSSISQGGFGIEEWDLLCSILLRTGGQNGRPLVSSRYTVVQLFKAILQFLAVKDLTTPMAVGSTIQLPQTETPVLYDATTGINIFFKMTPWSYQSLQEEASLTLATINARNEDNFDSVFIVRTSDALHRFDELYQIELPRGRSAQTVFDTLTEGLSDRVKRISLITPPSEAWEITEVNKVPPSTKMNIGLVLRAENKDRLVDHGPPAEEQEEAAHFRAFWGEKAELRRFKDGSIVESLVWSDDEPATSQIVKYLVKKHCDVQSSFVISIANQVDSLVLNQESMLKPADAFKLVNDAYQNLTTQLHNLEELPLRIRSITPADGQLSSSSCTIPLSSIQSQPANICIEFENSTRWPDHLPAIQHTKIAFLIKLGEVLQAAHAELSTRVGLENTSTVSSGHSNTSYLDIILPSSAQGIPPISFRLRIHHDRETTLIEKVLGSKTLMPPAQIAMSNALHMQKRTLSMQRHTMMLRTLTTRFPALSTTIRLLKKWTASHMLPPSLLPDPILDLLCIHTFTSPYPWLTPASAQTAFLRTLHTISRWDWASEPLLVDTSLDGSLFASANDVENLRTRFAAWRKLDPNMNSVVLFIGSNLDNTGVVWTQGQQPPRVLVGRLTALAKASVAVIRNKGIDMRKEDWRSLFQSPLSDFDFLIHLKRGFGRREEQKSAGKFKNLQLQEEMNTNAIGFDPVQLFVVDIEKTFEQSILFLYDRDGGRVIAGLWNPRVLKQQDFRVRLGLSSMPVFSVHKDEEGGKDMAVINQAGILAEIAMMGEGLVQKIEVIKDFVH